MKKILLLVGILLSSAVQAEDYLLPEGCYVSYSNPSACFDIAPGDNLIWNLVYDQSTLERSYGPAVSVILSRYRQDVADLEEALYNWEFWYNKSSKQAKQIKRLKAQIAALK